ncbi:MAG: ATP-binding cassette domain-containing protein [Chlamydiia bacterium]|nr:ATP-binding cassette domain-containing protein [Chlamydiia bacterium]
MDKVIIKVRDLAKSYGELQVLKGLSLDIYEGETLVILGRSGVGKSVLLRQLIGIEKPDKGTVEVKGIQIATLSETERAKAIKDMGMLFQSAALFDSLTVGENIAFYLTEHRNELSVKEIKDRVSHALKMVGLQGTENKMPSDLSGGMRKRAGLARLIVYRPQILLYDEPTTGLDPITAEQINQLINQTKRELKATSIVVTHDIHSALTVGDRLAFHHDGKLIHIAKKEEFFKIDDPLLQAFLKNAMVKGLTDGY